MLEAGAWGLFAGSSLLIGAVAGMLLRLPHHLVAAITGFGAGVLISAVAFELTEEAYAIGGADSVAAGLAAGAIVFFVGDRYIERMEGAGGDGTSKAIAFGAGLDAVPESAAIGLSVLGAGTVSPALVGAVFLSNVPEALSSTAGAMDAGHRRGRVIARWAAIVVLSGVSAALGYVLLDGASDNLIAFTQAFAGGAVLCMLTDTMIPKAFEDYDRKPQVGLTTVLGFAVAFLLSTM
ncbi:MAG: ZIP family metal transporter [Solirubrobacterales bacterium]